MTKEKKEYILSGMSENTFGEQLQRLVRERGMTQEEIAGMVGISRIAIRNLMYGANQPSLKTLDGLAKAFDLPLALLISWCGYDVFSKPHVRVTLTIPEQYSTVLQELAAFLGAVELEQTVVKQAILQGNDILEHV